MNIKLFATIIMLLNMPIFAYGEGCTIDLTVPSLHVMAVSPSNQMQMWQETVSVNVVCPNGQAWSLFADNPINVIMTNGNYAGTWGICRYGVSESGSGSCFGTNKITDGFITSGTGTGSIQTLSLAATFQPGNVQVIQPGYRSTADIGVYSGVMPSYLRITSASVNTMAGASITHTVNQACSLDVSVMPVITFTGLSDQSGSSSFGYACGTGGPAISISLDAGLHASGGIRRTSRVGGGYIPYHLFWDSSRTQEIGTASNNVKTLLPPGDTNNLFFWTVFKEAAMSTDGVGSYTDLITLTITY